MSKTETGTELTALIKRAMRGNTQAFEELAQTFSEDILYNLFIRLDDQNKADVEDAAQEVVLALYKSIGKLKSPHAFYAYLSTVVHNMAYKYNHRASKLRTEDVDEHEQAGVLQAPRVDQPEEVFDRKQATVLLASYIEQLPKKQREVLFLYYYRDLSYAQIAERLGITTSTVGTNISKAKGALKKMLEEGNQQSNATGDTSASASSFDAAPALDAEAVHDSHDAVTGRAQQGKLTPETDAFAGFAAAPLIHDALDHTMSQNALHESAKTVASYAQTLATSHPEVVAASAAVVAPKILKGVGVAAAAVLVTAGSFFGLQAASVSCSPVTETSTAIIADYKPDAHIVFVGGTEADEPLAEEGNSEEGTSASVEDASDAEASPEHVNPVSASVMLDEGFVGSWRIVNNATGELEREGSAEVASLTGLAQGEYSIIFELSRGDDTGFAEVQRSFVVQA